MSCPTCNHTMHNVGHNLMRNYFLCPRCGTLKTTGIEIDLDEEILVPALVGKCKKFEPRLYTNYLIGPWRSEGIAEAIGNG